MCCSPPVYGMPRPWPPPQSAWGGRDALGAGAVLAHLAGKRSAEAEACVALFERHQGELRHVLAQTSSGRELESRGHNRDKEYAAALNASAIVPRFDGVAYVAA